MIRRDEPLHQTLISAIAVLDDCIEDGPKELEQELFEAVRMVARARDELIRRQREHYTVEQGKLLNRLNSVLSVLAGGAYPIVGVHLDRIRKGRDALAGMITPDAR